MECPFLQKINFKKINQIQSDDSDCFDVSENSEVVSQGVLKIEQGE